MLPNTADNWFVPSEAKSNTLDGRTAYAASSADSAHLLISTYKFFSPTMCTLDCTMCFSVLYTFSYYAASEFPLSLYLFWFQIPKIKVKRIVYTKMFFQTKSVVEVECRMRDFEESSP